MNAVLHCHACRQPGAHRLHDLNFCTDHYIEALEHSAHIVTATVESLNEAADKIDRLRVERLAERVAQCAKEKKKREELSGRPEGNLPAYSI